MKSSSILFLLVCLLAVLMVAGCGQQDGAEIFEPEDWDGTVHTIAAIYPLTGGLSDYAENNIEAAKLAAGDVNRWLKEEAKDWRVRLVIDDTQLEGPVALRKMQSWYGDGVTFFAGPMGSGEASELISFANANQILYVSPSSTSTALSIPDDFLFRFCTDDLIQGPAIAGMVKASGVEHLIFAWRNEVWGDGLQAAAEASMEGTGIQIYPQKLAYDPLKEDFTTDVALLDGYVTDLVDQGVPLDKIGVSLISFGEAESFLAQAANYDQLKELFWFGSDGTVNNAAIVNNETSAQFASDTRFLNTMNRPSVDVANSRLDYVKEHIVSTLGREPEAYTYNTYDIIWALALSIDEAGYDSVAAKEILPRVADVWTAMNGASGHIVLNENGDRSLSDYDLVLINEDLEWETVGFFQWSTQDIVWDRTVY